MHENDHTRNGNATTPNAHQEQGRRPQAPPTDVGRPKPGGPIFPLQKDPEEPDKPGSSG